MGYSEAAASAVADYIQYEPKNWVEFILQRPDYKKDLGDLVYWIVRQRLESLSKKSKASDHHATSILRQTPDDWREYARKAIEDHLQEVLPNLAQGHSFAGYEILESVGFGGMGMVYKAKHNTIRGKVAAIKVATSSSAAESGTWSTVYDVAKCDDLHQEPTLQFSASEEGGIVPAIYGAGEIGDYVWIAMEFVDGETLKDMANREAGKNLTIDEWWEYTTDLIRLTEKLAKSIGSEVHSKGIAHNDIKPSNIKMHKKTGRLRLLDFGIAQRTGQAGHVENAESEAEFSGTPEFAAPEIVNGTCRGSVAADVYALASTLFFCMSRGRHARGNFPLEPNARIEAANSSKPENLHGVLIESNEYFKCNEESTQKLCQFFESRLSEDPGCRGTMKEFAEQLSEVRSAWYERERKESLNVKPRLEVLSIALSFIVASVGFCGAYLALIAGRDIGWPDRLNNAYSLGAFGFALCVIAAGESGRNARRCYQWRTEDASASSRTSDKFIDRERLAFVLRFLLETATTLGLSWSSVALSRELVVWLHVDVFIDVVIPTVVVTLATCRWRHFPVTTMSVFAISLPLAVWGSPGSAFELACACALIVTAFVYIIWRPKSYGGPTDSPVWLALSSCCIAWALSQIDDDTRRIHVRVAGESVVSRLEHKDGSVALVIGGDDSNLLRGEIWLGELGERSVRGRSRHFASSVRRVSFEADEAVVLQMVEPSGRISVIDDHLNGQIRSMDFGDETVIAFEFLPQLGLLAVGFQSGGTRIYDLRKPVRDNKSLAPWMLLMPEDSEAVRVVIAPATVPWIVCGHGAKVVKEEFAPGGESRGRTVSYKDTTIRIWDYGKMDGMGRFRREVMGFDMQKRPKATLVGHSSTVRCLAWSNDDRYLVSGSGAFDKDAAARFKDSSVRVWDVNGGVELHRFEGHVGPVLSVDISPENTRVASGGGRSLADLEDNHIRLWNLGSGELERTLKGHRDDVIHVRFLSEQKLLSVSRDRTIRIWDL